MFSEREDAMPHILLAATMFMLMTVTGTVVKNGGVQMIYIDSIT